MRREPAFDIYRATSHEFDEKSLLYKRPMEGDYDLLIDKPVKIYSGDELKIVYDWYDGDGAKLTKVLKSINYGKTTRSGGLNTESRVIGFQPRLAVRNDYCARAALAEDAPEAHDYFMKLGAEMSSVYAATNPERYARHAMLMDMNILPEWRIPESVYTSGIINQNNALDYHYDRGNFADCWSGMLALSSRVKGGELIVPEYRIAFAFTRPAVIFFDGQALLHGVTEITRPTLGYRYSVVFYSLKQICKCLPMEQEIARAQEMRTVREKRRLIYDKHKDVTPANVHKFERKQGK